ncbi:MAG: hypothetical protein ABI945_07410 [Nitrospirales bacterium]
MKRYAAMLIVIVGVGYLGSLVFANPAMLPKHPGYPASSDTSPVTNQALANDPGQLSLTVEQSSLEAASSEDAHVAQRLRGSQDNRMMEGPADSGIETNPSMPERKRMPKSSEGK